MLNRTALHELHQRRRAKLAPFAGFELPLYYPSGATKEHLLCRESAAVFDVSHMGQIDITDDTGSSLAVLTALEQLILSDLIALNPGQQRYGLLLTESGGILDDLMVMNVGTHVRQVNAACVDTDLAWLQRHLTGFTLSHQQRANRLTRASGPGVIGDHGITICGLARACRAEGHCLPG